MWHVKSIMRKIPTNGSKTGVIEACGKKESAQELSSADQAFFFAHAKPGKHAHSAISPNVNSSGKA